MDTRETKRPICLIEPQMKDVHHAPFNAALLHAVVLAYPEVPIAFESYPEHQKVVRGILDDHAPGLSSQIEWRTAALPNGGSLSTRWVHSYRWIRRLLARNERLLFCSISRMQLAQLKRSMGPGDLARTVLHGDLDQIECPSQERFPKSLMSLERVLLSSKQAGLRYVLLGESIRARIPERFVAAFADAAVIDHPYHFPALATVEVDVSTGLVFGALGNSGDARLVESVVRKVRDSNDSIRFRLVGFLSDTESVERVSDVLEDATAEPISRELFVERARQLTHVLWLAGSGSFRLRASGTFFDALAYGKPLVYTANSYIDLYFALDPGIGVRCDGVDAVPGAILQLAASTTAESYELMQASIVRLRERFTPAALATRLAGEFLW